MSSPEFNSPSSDTLVLREWFWDLWDELESMTVGVTQNVISHDIVCRLNKSTLTVSSSFCDVKNAYDLMIDYG